MGLLSGFFLPISRATQMTAILSQLTQDIAIDQFFTEPDEAVAEALGLSGLAEIPDVLRFARGLVSLLAEDFAVRRAVDGQLPAWEVPGRTDRVRQVFLDRAAAPPRAVRRQFTPQDFVHVAPGGRTYVAPPKVVERARSGQQLFASQAGADTVSVEKLVRPQTALFSPGPSRPATTNELLQERAVRRAVRLHGFGESQVREMRDVMGAAREDLRKTLEQRLSAGVDRGPFTTQRTKNLLAATDEILTSRWNDLYRGREDALITLAKSEARWQKDLIQGLTPGFGFDMTLPSDNQIRSIVTERPLEGALLRDWVGEFSARQRLLTKRTIQAGLLQGLTNDQIISRVVGIGNSPTDRAAVPLKHYQAEALVRTAVQHTANAARAATIEENTDVVKGWQWVATLDTRTCPVCGSLDGQTFDSEGVQLGEAKPTFVPRADTVFDPAVSPRPAEGDRNWSALQLTDGTVVYHPEATTHADAAERLGVPFELVDDGGFITPEGYRPGAADAARLGEQARARERALARRGTRASTQLFSGPIDPVTAPRPNNPLTINRETGELQVLTGGVEMPELIYPNGHPLAGQKLPMTQSAFEELDHALPKPQGIGNKIDEALRNTGQTRTEIRRNLTELMNNAKQRYETWAKTDEGRAEIASRRFYDNWNKETLVNRDKIDSIAGRRVSHEEMIAAAAVTSPGTAAERQFTGVGGNNLQTALNIATYAKENPVFQDREVRFIHAQLDVHAQQLRLKGAIAETDPYLRALEATRERVKVGTRLLDFNDPIEAGGERTTWSVIQGLHRSRVTDSDNPWVEGFDGDLTRITKIEDIGKQLSGMAMRQQNRENANKALDVLMGRATPDEVLGDAKVRSFYNNILHPHTNKDVTIDFHTINFGAKAIGGDQEGQHLQKGPGFLGKSAGARAVYAEEIRRYAESPEGAWVRDLPGEPIYVDGVPPSRVQEIAWAEHKESLYLPDHTIPKVGKGQVPVYRVVPSTAKNPKRATQGDPNKLMHVYRTPQEAIAAGREQGDDVRVLLVDADAIEQAENGSAALGTKTKYTTASTWNREDFSMLYAGAKDKGLPPWEADPHAYRGGVRVLPASRELIPRMPQSRTVTEQIDADEIEAWTFVSPNDGDEALAMKQAPEAIRSRQQALRTDRMRSLALENDLAVTRHDALGGYIADDGTPIPENSSVGLYKRGEDMRRIRLQTAVEGHNARQKDVLLFSRNDKGKDTMHYAEIPQLAIKPGKGKDAEEVYKALAKENIMFPTLQLNGSNKVVGVYFVNQGTDKKVAAAFKRALGKLAVKDGFRDIRGDAEFLLEFNNDRDAAFGKYREIVKGTPFEQQLTEWTL
jgi:SPP1 gp7 family putative phage head morphogenesis protein